MSRAGIAGVPSSVGRPGISSLLTVSNLYPRPDRPQLGVFNLRLFEAMADVLEKREGDPSGKAGEGGVRNLCFVPEWRAWRWKAISRWPDAGSPRLVTQYVPVCHIPWAGRNWAWRLYAASLRTFVPVARTCDALYAAWLYPDGVAAAALAKRASRPVWVMVQGSDTLHLTHPRRRAAIRLASEAISGFICVWRGLGERLVAAGVAADKVHVVPNGVDAERFRYRTKEDAARELHKGLPDGLGEIMQRRERVVLFVGGLVPVKDPKALLRAFKRASRMRLGPDPMRLVFVGDGPLRRSLEWASAAAGLRDRVTFAGNRPHDEVPYWMNWADCLCLTSRSEGMPNAVLEAMASGLPVVATDVGACAEMVGQETAARVVPVGGEEAMARAIREILADEPDRRALASRHARRSWHRQAEEILERIEASVQASRPDPDARAGQGSSRGRHPFAS
jgi:glycosyltransferase involved in cell wall biosynthesis